MNIPATPSHVQLGYLNPRLHNRPMERSTHCRVVDDVELMKGTWVGSLPLYAVAEVDGLRWYRTCFGGRLDREDWVAEVPHKSLAVTGWDLERKDGDVIAGMRAAVAAACANSDAYVRHAERVLRDAKQRRRFLAEAAARRPASSA